MTGQPLTLRQLNDRVARALSVPGLQNVWVVAELMDLRVNHGHCYMELIEKDPSTGVVNARLRAVIWASNFARINAEFMSATSRRRESGIKLMVCGSVSYHAAYGMSFVISAINAAYTMGDAERRRREILVRLQKEGMLDLNRSLEWPDVPSRIAVISAPGAAGFGDFCHQLSANPSHLRFSVKLFTAVMQGERTVPTVISALEAIAADIDSFDCVVIIRGGGATSDLQAFDDYDLAANVAQFPLPVIVGIGHERDVTVLDYVANMRVKTPTAAAEWLIGRGEAALEALRRKAADILQSVTDRLAGANMQLAYAASALSTAPVTAMERAQAHLRQDMMTLAGAGARRIAPELSRLDAVIKAIATAGHTAIGRAGDRLSSKQTLIDALSPQATLSRGYSITRIDGRAVRRASELVAGAVITTTLAGGTVSSTVNPE